MRPSHPHEDQLSDQPLDWIFAGPHGPKPVLAAVLRDVATGVRVAVSDHMPVCGVYRLGSPIGDPDIRPNHPDIRPSGVSSALINTIDAHSNIEDKSKPAPKIKAKGLIDDDLLFAVGCGLAGLITGALITRKYDTL